jgi:predicted transcriptional regulator
MRIKLPLEDEVRADILKMARDNGGHIRRRKVYFRMPLIAQDTALTVLALMAEEGLFSKAIRGKSYRYDLTQKGRDELQKLAEPVTQNRL